MQGLKRTANLYLLLCLCLLLQAASVAGQVPMSLQEAIDLGLDHYAGLQAKQDYARSTAIGVAAARRDYWPDLTAGLQQSYGTVNGQTGPVFGFGGVNTVAAGPALPDQNWNAAFGSLYLVNMNWEFFSFGRAKNKIRSAQAAAERDMDDWQQEVFQHKIRIAAAYLNLLAAQQLRRSYEENLRRADTFRRIVVTKALNGLIAGVDSAQANAERASAAISLVRAQDAEAEQGNKLAILLGITPRMFLLDTAFVFRTPSSVADTDLNAAHPVLQWYKSRVAVSKAQERYLKGFYFPSFSLVGVLQTRGSGFGGHYLTDQQDFSAGYWDGVRPSRTNYLFGLALSWNITRLFRSASQVKAQHFQSQGLQEEYHLAVNEFMAQRALADTKMNNALRTLAEVPVQVKAAEDAYRQKTVLYKNGLTNLVEVMQAQYALIRAETDRDIAHNNVWQALLLEAAATGDFNLFEEQL